VIDRSTDTGFQSHTARHIAHWDAVADRAAARRATGRYYHRRLARVYAHLVAPGESVLELGCGRGDLLAALKPRRGVGVDFSPRMIEEARRRHPDLEFIVADAHTCDVAGTFDVIILSDLVNDVWDVQAVFEHLRARCTPATRIVLNMYSHLWEGPLWLAAKLGLATPLLPQNWLTRQDVGGLLALAGFDVVKSWRDTLLPLPLPLVAPFANRVLARLWPLTYLCITNVVVARPAPAPGADATPSVTVLVPARNEAGNIRDIIARVPEMGSGTQLLFVEGNSTDDTFAVIEREIAALPPGKALLIKQPGKGKGDAVRAGFDRAGGDILMILDADLTVPPEDLPRFYDAIVMGRGEFINGVRLVYPMQERAMRFFNLLGNKFFSAAFSWLLGQPVKDTLCGTKVLRRTDYQRIAANRSYFGDFDPFGDFDLLFGAAKLNMKIVDLPIRYRERTYGDTNINRWRHGVLLLRMVLFAARRIKFV
jgi:SAM-dependent methyltransferase